MINAERLLETFLSIVRLGSPSRRERPVVDFLRAELERLGFEAREDAAGDRIGGNAGNLIAWLPPRDQGQRGKPLLFNAHMDRVPPGEGIRPVVGGGVVRSDGTTNLGADDAAGLSALLEAARVLVERVLSHPGVEFLFTVGEEAGLDGAKALDVSQLRARQGYTFDSSGPVGTVIVQGPAQASLTFEMRGKAAHAGLRPEQGVNAILAAARAIERMPSGRIDPVTTANVGLITGGTATNVVPDYCRFEAEARSLDPSRLAQQVRRMELAAQDTAQRLGAEAQVKVEEAYPAWRIEATHPVVERVTRAIRRLGRTPEVRATGGGSDVNVLSAHGLEMVNLGMGYERVHTFEEAMPVAELEAAARLALELMAGDAS